MMLRCIPWPNVPGGTTNSTTSYITRKEYRLIIFKAFDTSALNPIYIKGFTNYGSG